VTLLISPSDLERLKRIHVRLKELGRSMTPQEIAEKALREGLERLERETR
jgi:hypothetical protein